MTSTNWPIWPEKKTEKEGSKDVAKLYEHLDIGMVAELVPDVMAGLELIKEEDPKRPLRVRKDWQQEVGVPLMRTVHAIMWQRSQTASLTRGFVRSWKGSITGILRDNLKVPDPDGKSLQALASQVAKVLSINGMAENHGGKGLGAVYWLRPWDPKIELSWTEHRDKKLDAQVAQQEAKNPPQPVTTTVDLSMIPKPKDATPEAVLAYVETLVAAHHRLEALYEEAMEENSTLKTQIEEAGAVKWEITDALGEIVGS